MKSWSRHIITVYEHDKLTLKRADFTEAHLAALQRYYGQNGTPFFSLIHNGVKFNHHVGVVQVGGVFVEVLPKMDQAGGTRNDQGGQDDVVNAKWQSVLIRMLKIAMDVEASETSTSRLSLKSNTILDLYLELFIRECEKLVRLGLTRRYRRVSGNHTAVKGKLKLSRHLRTNIIHKERFYIEHSRYDRNHLIHQLLHETLLLLSSRHYRPEYYSRVRNLLLEFDQCDRISPAQKHFDGIELNRKTEHYRKALNIARLILLNFHPDVTRGQTHVLALMFDMNQLWEKYIGRLLRKFMGDRYHVEEQSSAVFWKPEVYGWKRRLRPDFLLISRLAPDDKLVIDTKWKATEKHPSDEDLRQIFAYNQLYGTDHGILLYPGGERMVTTDMTGDYSWQQMEISRQSGVHGQFLTDGGGNCSMVWVNILNQKGELRYDSGVLASLIDF